MTYRATKTMGGYSAMAYGSMAGGESGGKRSR